MANTKVSALTATTTAPDSALAYVVLDPSGTPLSRKITVKELVGHSTAGSIDPTGTNDCASAINSAMSALSSAGGGTLYIPAGTFKVGSTLSIYQNVSVRGAGRDATILKSSAATAMWSCTNTNFPAYYHEDMFTNIAFDGNATGTTGIDMTIIAWFSMRGVRIGDFTSYLMDLQGPVTCSFKDIHFGDDGSGGGGTTPTGIRMRGATVSGQANAIQPNHNLFEKCVFSNNTTWAVDIDHGANNFFHGCDFEFNGTNANDSTGIINVTNPCPNGEGPSITLRNCWFEANKGYAALKHGAPVAHDAYVRVDDTVCNFNNFSGTALKYGIYMDGSGNRNRLVTTASKIGSSSVNDVYLSGAGAYWTRIDTVCDSESHASGNYSNTSA